ncbi:MAG: hypothetical protein V4736_07625 [Bdellovibrionota bacterium]
MNIKGLFGNNISTGVRSVERPERAAVRTDITHDRDGNGQEAFQRQEQEHREPMSDEQIENCVQYLKDLPAVKEHKWKIEVVKDGDKRFVFVRDNLGSIIRRIPEMELWSLPSDLNDKRGQLFKKEA